MELPSPLHNTYFILRHGESEANKAGIIVSGEHAGTSAYGLTDLGRQQAAQAGQRLREQLHALAPPRNEDAPRRVVFVSSNFKRALETAQQAQQALTAQDQRWPASLRVDRRLRERFFGEWDLQSNAHYEDVWLHDAASATHTKFGVESLEAVVARLALLLRDLEGELRGCVVVLVSHGDTLQILQTALAGMDVRTHRSLPHLTTAELRRVGASHNQPS